MTARDNVMSPEAANAVYDILVTHAGAPENRREVFVHAQTDRFCPEHRFFGNLGSGGKFRRGTGFRADGTWGEHWYIDAYPEDTTTKVRAIIAVVNPLLAPLRAAHLHDA